MTFKELYKKYEDGLASPDEVKQVEEAIETFEVLTERYLDEEDLDLNIPPETESAAETSVKTIKKTVRRKKWVIILTSIVLTVIIVFSSLTLYQKQLMPRLNKVIYKDMLSHTYEPALPDLFAVLDTYCELHMPDRILNSIYVEATGLGSYDINILYSGFFGNDGLSHITAQLDKGNLILPYEFFDYLSVSTFTHDTYGYKPIPFFPAKKETVDRLKSLSDELNMYACVSFGSDINMNELYDLTTQYESLDFIWTAVRSCERGEQSLPIIGFNLSDRSVRMYNINDYYPYYNYMDNISGNTMEQHFLSLLDFQLDHLDVLDRTAEFPVSSSSYYNRVMEYIEENGVYSYGVIVTGSSSDLLPLIEEENVCDVYIKQAEYCFY